MLIRVLEITGFPAMFHFDRGEPIPFVEVDWFRDDEDMMASEDGRAELVKFVQGKPYFDPAKSYLMLHPTSPMTINYSAD